MGLLNNISAVHEFVLQTVCVQRASVHLFEEDRGDVRKFAKFAL